MCPSGLYHSGPFRTWSRAADVAGAPIPEARRTAGSVCCFQSWGPQEDVGLLETLCLWVGSEEEVAGAGLSDEGSVQLMRDGGAVGTAPQLTWLGLQTGGWARGRSWDCHTEGAGMSPSGPRGAFRRIRVGCWSQAGWRGVLRWGKPAKMGQVREGETGRPAGTPWPRAGADGRAEAGVGGEVSGAWRTCLVLES